MCNCRCNNNHRVVTVTNTGTAIELTLMDSTNIGDMERFNLICRKPVSALVTGDPLPVVATVNGVASIPLKNAYGQPLLSNVVPWGKTCGKFIMGGATTTAADSYIWLETPCYA